MPTEIVSLSHDDDPVAAAVWAAKLGLGGLERSEEFGGPGKLYEVLDGDRTGGVPLGLISGGVNLGEDLRGDEG